jgi:hypothetical protein
VLTATWQLLEATNNLGTVTFSFPLGQSSPVFAEAFDNVTIPDLPPGWLASRPTS